MIESNPTNQCKPDGGGCSKCQANGVYLICKFGEKNTFLKQCRFWKAEAFCDCLAAQEAAKPGSYSS